NSANKCQLWLDDIVVKNVSNSYDVALMSNSTYKYTAINTNHPISAVFRNEGSTPGANRGLNEQVGSNAVVAETKGL
ncbi:UNVERIFIED_CONTAM: hypothetical protein IGO34_37005, partial [Salmonella enterica subsp. enterica serovar Weltevreden]